MEANTIKNSIMAAFSAAAIGGTVKLLRKIASIIVMRVVAKEKDKLVKLLNAKIDLPKLTEDQEKKIMDSLYDAMVDSLTVILKGK